MLVTKSWIEANYKKFNQLYFNGVLPNVIFKISRSKNTWGYASYIVNYTKSTVRPVSITMSNYYDSPENVKISTLLHEMIHIYDYIINPQHFVINGKKTRGYNPHGVFFKNECNRLKKFGYYITANVTNEELNISSTSKHIKALENNKIKSAIVCVVYGSKGFNYFMKTNDANIDTFICGLICCDFRRSLGGVKDIKFYRIKDKNIAMMKSCAKTIKGYKYSTDDIKTKLKSIQASEMKVNNKYKKIADAIIASA